jgi:hypothetical protein
VTWGGRKVREKAEGYFGLAGPCELVVLLGPGGRVGTLPSQAGWYKAMLATRSEKRKIFVFFIDNRPPLADGAVGLAS